MSRAMATTVTSVPAAKPATSPDGPDNSIFKRAQPTSD